MAKTKGALAGLMLSAALVLGLAACRSGDEAQPAPAEPEGGAAEATTAVDAEAALTETAVIDTSAAINMQFEPAQAGGTLVIGQGQEPDSLYLYQTGMLASTHVLNGIYDGPYDNLEFEFQSVIVETLPRIEDGGPDAVMDLVGVAPGELYVDPLSQEVVTATEQVAELPQLTVRFRLREGVTWQDGTPVTAADSVFSQTLACDAATPTSKFLCERTASYSAVDPSTVEWRGLPGFTDQTYFTNIYTPLPRHQSAADGRRMEELSAEEVLADSALTRTPYSYGAFMIEDWSAGESITLVRNPHYWRAAEGLPFLDSVVHRFISDGNALLAAAIAGEIDIATTDGLDVSQAEVIDQAVAEGTLTASYLTGTTWEHMNFNLDPVDERPPFAACLEIRQAIAHATDRQNMVDVVMKGKSRIAHTFVPQEHWAYPPEDMIVAYEYDPEKARQILEDLGFSDADGDGIREATRDIACTITTGLDGATEERTIPAGTPLALEIVTTEGRPYRTETTLLMQQNLKDVGIDASLQYLAANIFFEDGPKGPVFGRITDLSEYAFSFGVVPPVSRYYCTDIPSEANSWAGSNHPAWCDPDYDQAAKKAENTIERAEALPYYHDALNRMMQALPALGLYARVNVRVASPEVLNFRPDPSQPSETWNIEALGFAEGTTPASPAP